MKNKKTANRSFTLMILGQIISIFGNYILRYALPLYLYNQTGSAASFGLVSAASFIPMIVLSPIGGMIADRVNKRNVMVILDFSTAGIMFVFTVLHGKVTLIPLMVVTLMLLYGIQGAYQPTVQASIPALVEKDQILRASALVNQVNMLASLLGPVIGGIIFGMWGLGTILVISILCFTCSAVMEMFIHIPFKKDQTEEKMWDIVKGDFRASVMYIGKEKAEMKPVMAVIALINLFYSSMLTVGLPVIIMSDLGFTETLGNQLYGYAQGAMGAGGLAGGILISVFAKRLKISSVVPLLLTAVAVIVPCGVVLMTAGGGMFSYVVIIISSFIAMAMTTMFSIQMIAYVQQTTPEKLLGKVMAFVMTLCMCAQPAGQVLYGALFENFSSFAVVFFAVFVSGGIALVSAKLFRQLEMPAEADACVQS